MSKPKEKSAEVIVAADTSLCPKGTTQEVSQSSEGFSQITAFNSIGRRASPILNEEQIATGAPRLQLWFSEPPYTRPVRTVV